MAREGSQAQPEQAKCQYFTDICVSTNQLGIALSPDGGYGLILVILGCVKD